MSTLIQFYNGSEDVEPPIPPGYVLSPFGTGNLIKRKHYKERLFRFEQLKKRREEREKEKKRLI